MCTLVVAIAIVGCASQVATPRVPIRGLSGIEPAPPCDAGSLRISPGDPLSPETGERPLALLIENRGSVPCWLSGYPQIRLVDAAGAELPMTYRDGGGYVTTAPPRQVVLPPGGQATSVIAKYRCDLGDVQGAVTIEVALPGSTEFATPPPVAWGPPDLGYCGPNDPGDLVDISPVSPDVQTAIGWPRQAPLSSAVPAANS